MKKIFLSLLILVLSISGFVSCTDETFDPVATNNEKIVMSSPANGTFVLSATNANAEAFNVKWTSSYFGYQAAVKYYLQVIKASGSFNTSPAEMSLGEYSVGSIIDLEKTITNRELNSLFLAANGSIGTTESYKLRVVGKPSALSSTAPPSLTAVSNEVTVSGNPYDTFDEFPKLYLPGNYGGASSYADWSGSGNSATIFSAASNGTYEGFVWMNNASPEFKFNSDPSWSGNDKGENNPSGAFSGVLGTAQNIKPADGAGTYFFTVNWPSLTYTMSKQQVAIIGAAVVGTGWGSPVYLDFDTNPASPYYRMYTKDVSLTADEFLIRLKDDWSAKMGTISGNNGDLVTIGNQNKVKIGGGNLKMPSGGNFKIVADLRNAANYNVRLMPN